MYRFCLNRRTRARTLAAFCGVAMLGVGMPLAHAAESDDPTRIPTSPAPTSVSAEPKGKLQDVQEEVAKKIEEADAQGAETSAALQAATDALANAQSDLVDARQQLAYTKGELATAEALDALMQRRLDAAQSRLRRAESALNQGEGQVVRQQDDLRAMVVASYEQGDPSLMGLSMVFSDQDPTQIAGNMNASASVANKESAILDGLEATEVMLAVQRAEMAAAKAEVALRRREAADNLLRKQALESQARAAESQVSRIVSLRAQAKDAALKAKKSDMAVLAGLVVERDRIADLIAAEASSGTVYTGPVDGNGYFDVPVKGPITSPFGWRIHPIFGYRNLHDGIDIGAPCGTPIRASARGKVLTQYFHTAYGNRIVIDNGERYGVGVATIVNHMSGFAVAEGERVKRGQVIGYVGNTGWSTGCHAHFTVLENGDPVDPFKWF